jgi:hypothetical protein
MIAVARETALRIADEQAASNRAIGMRLNEKDLPGDFIFDSAWMGAARSRNWRAALRR